MVSVIPVNGSLLMYGNNLTTEYKALQGACSIPISSKICEYRDLKTKKITHKLVSVSTPLKKDNNIKRWQIRQENCNDYKEFLFGFLKKKFDEYLSSAASIINGEVPKILTPSW